MKRTHKTDLTVLNNWTTLNDALKKLGEEDCRALLDHEVENRRRLNFITRIYSAFSSKRRRREVSELLKRVA